MYITESTSADRNNVIFCSTFQGRRHRGHSPQKILAWETPHGKDGKIAKVLRGVRGFFFFLPPNFLSPLFCSPPPILMLLPLQLFYVYTKKWYSPNKALMSQYEKTHIEHMIWYVCCYTCLFVSATDLNTWIAGSHGFAYLSMRATGSTSAAILLQSKHLIDTLASTQVSAWNATSDRSLASNFMKIVRKKIGKFPRSSRLLNTY